MAWLSFHHPTDNFLPFVRQLEKIFWTCRRAFTLQRTISERKTGVEEKIFSLPYNQRTLFRALSEKSFEVGEARTALLLQKVLTLSNGQNKSECHDFVSLAFPFLFYNGHFSPKTWHPFSKIFCFH